MESNRKKGVIVGVIASLVVVVILGVTFAIWNYSNTLQNQILVSGDIFMKYTESNELSITNALPKAEPGEDDYFEFKIEGRNKYSKPIWYEIVLNWGEEPTGDENTERTERIKDNLLMFRLVETKGGEDKIVLDNATYSDINKGKAIWVNTIDAKTDNVEITYKLYMWISPKTNIGNTSLADYDMDTWNDNVFASIKVSVNGDFNEKEIKSEIGTDVVKDTIGQPNGVIGVSNTNEKVTSESENIREYRYSGTGVNNYVYFNCKEKDEEGHDLEQNATNCEKWRIVGVFEDENGEEHLKIVRNEVLKNADFPEKYTVSGTEYNIQYTSSGDSAYWNKKVSGSNQNNDWATAGLQYWLNSERDDTTNPGYLSKINATAKSMIEDKTKYYLGTVTYYNSSMNGGSSSLYGIKDTPNEAYKNERATECADGKGPSANSSNDAIIKNETCRVWANNSATWEGSVALLYPSDYGYSADSEYWNTVLGYGTFNGTPSGTSWLSTANHGSYEWLLAPSSDGSSGVAFWITSGYVDDYYVYYSYGYGVRPSLNLKSQTKIVDGDGTEDNCYQLEPGQ